MELTLDQALQKGIEAHKQGKVQEADGYYTAILKVQPNHPDANHNMGVLAVGIGKVQESLPFFKMALEANSGIEQFWLSYIDALIKLNRMDDAKVAVIEAESNGAQGDDFEKLKQLLDARDKEVTSNNLNNQEPPKKQLQALLNLFNQDQIQTTIMEASQLLLDFPNSSILYNIIGAANRGLGNLDEAMKAYEKAISIKPDYAEAFYNMGNALKDQGKLKEAMEAFNKAISIKPDYAEVYNNMGNAFKDQGNLEEAIVAYEKAISIKPDCADVHRHLSTVKRYKIDDPHFLLVKNLYDEAGFNRDTKCNLNFALAKMYEDNSEFDKAFEHLSEGNALRKKILNYSINKDEVLFLKLEEMQPFLLEKSLKIKRAAYKIKPIFILGMPRSGTTLVEHIVSSHSKVTGAGELRYIAEYGTTLATGISDLNETAVSEFREKYLSELIYLSNGRPCVTDKMPGNFRFIPLICAAFPEAKIIHVQRDSRATCWSNFRQYFSTNDLGYCYNLDDLVVYYKLYFSLMQFWQSKYGERIYNLDYERLTTDQENETRKLIKYLEIDWENSCLSPQDNKRSVKTVSQHQVRQKVYTGSSQAWKKYQPFIDGVFDTLPVL